MKSTKTKTKTVNQDYETEREQKKREWKDRMIRQYAGYKYKALRGLVSLYYEYQEQRIATENRYRLIKELAGFSDELNEAITSHVAPLKKMEEFFESQIEKELAAIPVYTNWLSKQKGIGAIYSGCLIAWIDGKDEAGRQSIARFDNISKLLKYCGLSAIDGKVQRRSLGSHINYNPKLKTLMFKIGSSFLMAKNPVYRAVYDEAHKAYEARGEYDAETNPGGNKNKKHIQFRAMKKMERVFVANLWTEWRKLEGLPVSEPYIFSVGGHSLEHKIQS
jgi:hypothetical protein